MKQITKGRPPEYCEAEDDDINPVCPHEGCNADARDCDHWCRARKNGPKPSSYLTIVLTDKTTGEII